jgi:hypothetical protein
VRELCRRHRSSLFLPSQLRWQAELHELYHVFDIWGKFIYLGYQRLFSTDSSGFFVCNVGLGNHLYHRLFRHSFQDPDLPPSNLVRSRLEGQSRECRELCTRGDHRLACYGLTSVSFKGESLMGSIQNSWNDGVKHYLALTFQLMFLGSTTIEQVSRAPIWNRFPFS